MHQIINLSDKLIYWFWCIWISEKARLTVNMWATDFEILPYIKMDKHFWHWAIAVLESAYISNGR